MSRDLAAVLPVRSVGLEGEVKACVQSIMFTWGAGYLKSDVRFTSAAEELAYTMVMTYGGKRVDVGTITVAKGTTTTYRVGCGLPRDLVDVLLVPSAGAGRNTVNLKRYADVEVRIADVDTGGGGRVGRARGGEWGAFWLAVGAARGAAMIADAGGCRLLHLRD